MSVVFIITEVLTRSIGVFRSCNQTVNFGAEQELRRKKEPIAKMFLQKKRNFFNEIKKNEVEVVLATPTTLSRSKEASTVVESKSKAENRELVGHAFCNREKIRSNFIQTI